MFHQTLRRRERRGHDGRVHRPRRLLGPVPLQSLRHRIRPGLLERRRAKFYGTFTDLAFHAGRTSTAMALWLVEWAYGFGVVDRVGGPAVAIARTTSATWWDAAGISRQDQPRGRQPSGSDQH